MKKLCTLVSGLLMVVALSACGTAGVNDFDNRGVYDVNDYRGVNNVNDRYNVTNLDDRGIYTRPLKDSPLRNDPEVTDNDGNIFGADFDDNMVDDEELTRGRPVR